MADYIHPQRPGTWYVRGEDAFGRYCKSTGIPILYRGKQPPKPPPTVFEFEANLLESRKMEALGDKRIEAKDAPQTIETLEHFFWQGKTAKGISEDMRRTYANNWKQLKNHLITLDDCKTRAKLEAYVAARKLDKCWANKRTVLPPTIAKELTVFFYAWKECVEEGVLLPAMPGKPRNLGLDDYDEHEELKGTAYEIGTLLHVHRMILSQHNRDKFFLAFTTGLRFEEMNRLSLVRKIDLSDEPGVAAIFLLPREATKKKRARFVGLTTEAFECWKRLAPFDVWDSRSAFETACEKLGLPKITLRDCRASFATGVRDCDVGQAAIDAVMGHGLTGARNRYQKTTPQRAILVAQGVARWLARGKFGNNSVTGSNVVALR